MGGPSRSASGIRSETELVQKSKEQLYQYLVETSPDAIVLTDLDGHILRVNFQAIVLWECQSEEELLHKDFQDLVTPEDRGRLADNLSEIMGTGGIRNVEYTLLKRDRERFPAEVSASLILDGDWNPKAVVRIVRDITERKAREKALCESEARLRSVVENAADAIVSIDSRGNIVAWNPEAEAMFGYRTEDILGRPVTMIMPQRHKEAHIRGMERALATRRSSPIKTTYEVAGLDREGREIPVELSLSSWISDDEQFFTGIIRNIAERKMVEDAEKTYTIELKEANRLKDLFIDIMRHDLLNPASAIHNFTEILLDDETDEKKRLIFSTMKETTSKLIEMIETASLYSKIENLKVIDKRLINLDEVLRDSVKVFEQPMTDKGMQMEIKIEGKCPVKANPMIENVFSNLISNAIKYSPKGGRIEVGILDDTHECKAYVKDWGEGISDENKEKVFTRFERLGKEGIKGTGLGMAIAKLIMDIHGGEIWVEDNTCEYCDEQGLTRTKKCGSIFYVSLPKGND